MFCSFGDVRTQIDKLLNKAENMRAYMRVFCAYMRVFCIKGFSSENQEERNNMIFVTVKSCLLSFFFSFEICNDLIPKKSILTNITN